MPVLRPVGVMHWCCPAQADLKGNNMPCWQPTTPMALPLLLSTIQPLHCAMLLGLADPAALPPSPLQVCDQGGRKPFPTDKLLEQHLRYAHARQLCGICTAQGRRFPLEYEAFTDTGLTEHCKKEHPRWAPGGGGAGAAACAASVARAAGSFGSLHLSTAALSTCTLPGVAAAADRPQHHPSPC